MLKSSDKSWFYNVISLFFPWETLKQSRSYVESWPHVAPLLDSIDLLNICKSKKTLPFFWCIISRVRFLWCSARWMRSSCSICSLISSALDLWFTPICLEVTVDGEGTVLIIALFRFCVGDSVMRLEGNFPVEVLVTGCSSAFSNLQKKKIYSNYKPHKSED